MFQNCCSPSRSLSCVCPPVLLCMSSLGAFPTGVSSAVVLNSGNVGSAELHFLFSKFPPSKVHICLSFRTWCSTLVPFHCIRSCKSLFDTFPAGASSAMKPNSGNYKSPGLKFSFFQFSTLKNTHMHILLHVFPHFVLFPLHRAVH